MQIVTGRRGEPHVTSRQMQAVYRSFLGDFALLDVGAHLAATATASDNVRISDGVVAVQGIYAVIAYNEYDDNYIEPVSVGMKRIDTLILHYTKSNDIEDMQIEVVEGEEVVDNPVAPTIAEGGDAWEGTADIKVPIYDVLVTSFGLTVTPYSRMNTLIPTLDSIAERIPESIVTGVKGDSEALYRNGNVNITKENIGLGNVDNTADTDKPISTATQTALNLKADLTYVDAKISAAYHAGGSKTVAELTSALLIADNMGKVYNMSDSGVTTADFVEGAGEPINEGDNVGICNVGTEENPIYKFDLLSGFVDLSAYATTSAVNDGLAGKVDKVAGKGLSTEDYTAEEKTKLEGIEAQANKTIVDSSMSTTSTNPLQNKVITAELAGATTATGNPLTIESSESNLVECTAEVEAVQEGSGDPSPTNIRPITGQTEVVITDNGINQWDEEWEVGAINSTTGANATENNAIRSKNYISVKPNTSIYIKCRYATDKGLYIKGFDSNKVAVGDSWTFSNVTNTVINIPSNVHYLRFMTLSSYGNVYNHDISINYPSTDTDYHAYKGKTYTIQLGDTIYGGELDVLTGELRVTHGEVDLGDLSYSYTPGYGGMFYANVSGAKFSGSQSLIGYDCYCSQYASKGDIPWTQLVNGEINVGSDTAGNDRPYVNIKDNRYTDTTAFTTAVTGQTLVYELAEPYTIQLTPQQIRLLKGTNNISCNTGDLSIKYYPDNVLGQLKGDIESEYDERITELEEKANTPTIKQVEINRNAVSTDGSVMFTSLTGHIIVGTSISNDANGDKCVGIPYSMGNVPSLKIMNESTMAVLPNITISGTLYCIKL